MNKIQELHEKFEKTVQDLIDSDPALQEHLEKEKEKYALEERRKKILDFLRELRSADEKIPKIFTEGSCFRLCKILKVIHPNAIALYSHREGHWVTEIEGEYYDIHGRINKGYISDKCYEKTSEEVQTSAYIHTHSNNIGTSYNKYAEI